MKTSRELIDDIAEVSPAPGECAFWWLGQQGYILKAGGNVLYLDAYLRENPRRRVPPLLAAEEVTNADLFFGTHDHSDHIDRETWPGLAEASPDARFVVPRVFLPALADDLDIDEGRFIGMDDGMSVEVGGVKINGVASAHELLKTDPETGYNYFLGYVIEVGGVAVYHAGDTCNYEGLQTKLSRWDLDVVFLPINGRDAKRLEGGTIGNMTYQEAADLAGALEPRLTVPGHYDMFANNGEDPSLFADYMRVKYPHLAVKVCDYGERAGLPTR